MRKRLSKLLKWFSNLNDGEKINFLGTLVAFLLVLATIIAAIIMKPQDLIVQKTQISIDQTKEARLTAFAPTFTSTFTQTQEQITLSIRTATPTVTLTPEPTPTSETVVLFYDDFENGLSKWKVGEGWEIRQDEKGNHFACVQISGTNYSFITPRVTEIWQDYWLNLDAMIVEPLGNSVFTMDIHRNEKPELRAYQLQLSENKIGLSKYNPVNKKYEPLTDSQLQPSLTPQNWYLIQIDVGFGNSIKYTFDTNRLIEHQDGDFIPQGIIRLGASPNSNVCFDNVKVLAPK